MIESRAGLVRVKHLLGEYRAPRDWSALKSPNEVASAIHRALGPALYHSGIRYTAMEVQRQPVPWTVDKVSGDVFRFYATFQEKHIPRAQEVFEAVKTAEVLGRLRE